MNYEALGLIMVRGFISDEEETEILAAIPPSPLKKTTQRNSIRRYGSKRPYHDHVLSEDIPPYLDAISKKLVAAGHLTLRPSSVSINEYCQGQSLGPHIDSKESGPVICVLGLLGDGKMRFSKTGRQAFIVDFPQRCLLIMKGEIRESWNHAILPVPTRRYSIVFRRGE